MFFNDIQPVIEKFLAFISENWMLLPDWKSKMKEKNNITLIVSKNVTTVYDDRFDIIEEHNPHEASPIFFIFGTKQRHRKIYVISFAQ